MINVLVPMVGRNFFEGSEFQYPKPLIEIEGKPLISHIVSFLEEASDNVKFTFVINDEDCRKYNFDYVIKLIRPEADIIVLKYKTAGAACTCLLTIDSIDQEQPLLISSADHIITEGLREALRSFEERDSDSGVLCFNSIHPKWSFVRLDENENVIETAEKKPLSNNAIAGMYYFKKAEYFYEAAMSMIEKGASVDDIYYIAPSFNEMILENKKVHIYNILTEHYFNFYSPHKIKEYEEFLRNKRKKAK